MKRIFKGKYAILFKVLGLVVCLLLVKWILHAAGLESINLSALFSGLLGANIFLLGFLLSGVLGDYRESERIPGEIASILSTISDELVSAASAAKSPDHKAMISAALDGCLGLGVAIRDWMYRKVPYGELMERIAGYYRTLADLDGVVPTGYVGRMKSEHANLRRQIVRVNTIRETSFISSGYLIAVSASALLLIGLLLIRMDPFYESMFFVGVISYLTIFLILLIHDLDDPFGYSDNSSSEDVSLQPLEDALADLEAKASAPRTLSQDQ